MKKLTAILISIIVILSLLLFGPMILRGQGLIRVSTVNTSSSALLQEKLVELSEWTTLKYEYSNVIISRTEKNLSLIGLPDFKLAEVIKLISYTGYIKAGTDMTKIEITIDKSSKKVNAKVEKSKILDHVIVTETAIVEDVKGNIFLDYPPQTVFDEINASKQEIEKEKIDQGFLEEADRRLISLLESFFKSQGF